MTTDRLLMYSVWFAITATYFFCGGSDPMPQRVLALCDCGKVSVWCTSHSHINTTISRENKQTMNCVAGLAPTMVTNVEYTYRAANPPPCFHSLPRYDKQQANPVLTVDIDNFLVWSKLRPSPPRNDSFLVFSVCQADIEIVTRRPASLF